MERDGVKNSGFIAEPIVIEKDYVFGGYTKLTGEPLEPTGQWDEWLPPENSNSTPASTLCPVSPSHKTTAKRFWREGSIGPTVPISAGGIWVIRIHSLSQNGLATA